MSTRVDGAPNRNVQDKKIDNEAISDIPDEYQASANRKYKKRPGKVELREIESHTANSRSCDDRGYYIGTSGAIIAGTYEILRCLGQGSYGKVFQALHRIQRRIVALKVSRSTKAHCDVAEYEVRILQALEMNDPDNLYGCIHAEDAFRYNGHVFIVMQYLPASLYSFMKLNQFVPFPASQVRMFAWQLITSAAFLHSINLIHADLKPENIMLVDNSCCWWAGPLSNIPSVSHCRKGNGQGRFILKNTEVRLIDFGLAAFQDEFHHPVAATRHYRAPEIILGLGWTYPSDMWSIGCILVELFTGDVLFWAETFREQLAMMEKVTSSYVDPRLIRRVDLLSNTRFGNGSERYFKNGRLEFPASHSTPESVKRVDRLKDLEDIVQPCDYFTADFSDLLRRLLTFEPADRITAEDALNHRWFQHWPPYDEGVQAEQWGAAQFGHDAT